MADYKEMYVTLFRETTKVIKILQEAQVKTEEIYISNDPEDTLISLHTESDREIE